MMTSILARRAFLNCRPRQIYVQRHLHVSSIVQKKKSSGAVVIGDLSPGTSDDLFSDSPAQHQQQQPKEASSPSSSTDSVSPTFAKTASKLRQTPERRADLFNDLVTFVTENTGKKINRVRKSAWLQMLMYASSPKQLDEIAELLPRWRDDGREFDAAFSQAFVCRCQKLKSPDTALKVFGDFRKYNLKLTLPAGRQLIHSLHLEHPIGKVMLASALYNVHNLPPVAKDLISCAMFVLACYRHKSRESLQVAQAMIGPLEHLVRADVEARSTVTPDADGEVGDTVTSKDNAGKKIIPTEQTEKWLKWSLDSIDSAFSVVNGTRAEWLALWQAKDLGVPTKN